jgi:hypothetical protein
MGFAWRLTGARYAYGFTCSRHRVLLLHTGRRVCGAVQGELHGVRGGDPVNAGLKATGAFFFDESLATPGALLFDPDGLKVPYINFPRDGMYTMRMSSC